MAFYNEHDKDAAQWLRNLIEAGHVPAGVVDDRDIQQVTPEDLRGHDQVHLFAGIGGWSLALEIAGWPADRPVWTGSCPCQPFSSAGKRKGTGDERHLWPEMFRLIRECRPPVIFGEQVASAIGHGWLDGVFADLEAEGYACGAVVLGAHSVGAPHIRQRLYWVAESEKHRASIDVWAGQSHVERGGAVGGLELPISDGRRGERPADGRAPEAAWAGQAVRLEHPQGDGRQQRRAEPDGRGVAGGCGVDGIRHAVCPGLAAVGTEPSGACADDGAGLWRDSRIITCRDGKHRRIPIEPALFPLADGVPGRVGLLRGAGNAIVPQVAAEFVRAYMEVKS